MIRLQQSGAQSYLAAKPSVQTLLQRGAESQRSHHQVEDSEGRASQFLNFLKIR